MDSAQTLFCCGSSWMPCPRVYIAPKREGKERWGEGRGKGKRGRREDKSKPAHLFNTMLWTENVWRLSLSALISWYLGTCISRERASTSKSFLQGSNFSASFTNIFLWEGRQRWGKWGRGECNSYFCLVCYIQGLIYRIPCSMMVSF